VLAAYLLACLRACIVWRQADHYEPEPALPPAYSGSTHFGAGEREKTTKFGAVDLSWNRCAAGAVVALVARSSAEAVLVDEQEKLEYEAWHFTCPCTLG
jgi:hypothetical protein